MTILEAENRPWGKYEVICDEKSFKLKRIFVNPKQRLSYQSHEKRAETWVIIEGEPRVTIDDKSYILSKGETIVIPLNSKHRIENPTNTLVIFIEVQTGTYFGEDDIVRYEDDYDRK